MKQGELIDILKGKIGADERFFDPLVVDNFQRESPRSELYQPDAFLQLCWKGQTIRCFVEVKGRATPRMIRSAVSELSPIAESGHEEGYPAVLVPYLSEGVAAELRRAETSGFDLNGNFLILTPELLAIRLDRSNDYPESRSIKKIYSKKSSLVGRFLLAESRTFEKVSEIHQGIRQRGGEISLSTVSKVLSRLAEELLIHKKRGEIRVLQPDKLLDELRDGYRRPEFSDSLKLKLPEDSRRDILNEFLGDDWMWSGETSAGAYAATTSPAVSVAYTSAEIPADGLEEFEDPRFHNTIVGKTTDIHVYFDRREHLASPVETYLALAQMDKRDREVAREIRQTNILAECEDDV